MAQIIGITISLICIVLIGATYIVYPAIRYARLDKRKQIEKNKGFTPLVAVIFAAYNERDVITSKIKSIVESNYAADRKSVV